MKNRSGPKLPKSVLDKLNKDTKKLKLPETADEFLAQAIEDEESGDRWYSSDLLKSLRFYQRAYDGYLKSLELDNSLLDSYYNLSRLLFHVFNNFTKIDQIKLNTLDNIDQCFGNVIQELPTILKYFDFVMEKFELLGKKSWDLIYNSALIYQEYIDEDDDSLSLEQTLSLAQKSMTLYQQYIDHQLSELLEIMNLGEESEETGNNAENEIDEFEIITPVLILETIISAYKLVQSVYETGIGSRDEFLIATVSDWLIKLEFRAKQIINQDFGEKFNNTIEDKEEMDKNLKELKKLDQFIKFFNFSSSSEIINEMKVLEVENSMNFEYFLSCNDLLLLLLSTTQHSSETAWEVYSFVSSYFKRAQDIVTKEFESMNSNNDAFSSKISLIAKIMISRSDIEYQRSHFANETNKPILLKNVVNILKNLITWTNKNGGLRENIIDQLNRFYLRKKAMLRLSLLENGNIDGVLKDASSWTTELDELKDIYHI